MGKVAIQCCISYHVILLLSVCGSLVDGLFESIRFLSPQGLIRSTVLCLKPWEFRNEIYHRGTKKPFRLMKNEVMRGFEEHSRAPNNGNIEASEVVNRSIGDSISLVRDHIFVDVAFKTSRWITS
uniref:Uncharacterized protein n=1 Tax=Cannabis sativa TaxID=3483 RepID=A0A803QM77_CANSA